MLIRKEKGKDSITDKDLLNALIITNPGRMNAINREENNRK
jgi:hypothetical protein